MKDETVTDKKAKLIEFFKGDKFVELAGIKIEEITDEYAVCTAKVTPAHLNANGCVQGGMLYTLADFTFAVLGNYLHPATVTQCGHINYLRPAFTDTLTATARETERAGHTCLCEVVVKTSDGKVCSICNFNGFIKEK